MYLVIFILFYFKIYFIDNFLYNLFSRKLIKNLGNQRKNAIIFQILKKRSLTKVLNGF